MTESNIIIDQLKARIAELETQLEAARIQPEVVPTIEPNALYNVKQVQQRLDCKSTNVYDLLNTGQLAHVNIGSGMKGKRVWGRDITAFLDSRRTGGPTPNSSFKYLKLKRP